MCLICSDWEKGKLTSEEAWRNLCEMSKLPSTTAEELMHYFELSGKILEKEHEKRKA